MIFLNQTWQNSAWQLCAFTLSLKSLHRSKLTKSTSPTKTSLEITAYTSYMDTQVPSKIGEDMQGYLLEICTLTVLTSRSSMFLYKKLLKPRTTTIYSRRSQKEQNLGLLSWPQSQTSQTAEHSTYAVLLVAIEMLNPPHNLEDHLKQMTNNRGNILCYWISTGTVGCALIYCTNYNAKLNL